MALADLLCLPVDGEPVESRRGYLSDRVVRGAAALVDATGLVEQWEQWYRDDHPDWQTRGGRPGSIDIRHRPRHACRVGGVRGTAARLPRQRGSTQTAAHPGS